jgi:sigma-54 dependent transcriptional regulator, acetoin dehydrogenase operon transcriptional activator AcoR
MCAAFGDEAEGGDHMSPASRTVDGVPAARPEIAQSWHRASLAGVTQAGDFGRLVPGDIDQNSSLLIGAGPVLDELEVSLAGTGYSTILGDRECRVVRRWFDAARTEASFDALNIREGASVLEETIGTNALGTAFETHLAVTINGAEHFVETLRRFSCYGHPIRHPLTRRVEGVLDVTALAESASPLLPAVIARAVHDIEQRLLGGSRSSEKSLLAAFQQASGHRKHAVLAIGEDIVMSNQAASDLLSPSDVALLRVLAEEPPQRDDCALKLSLESGQTVTVIVTRVSGARRGALLRVEPCSSGPHLTPATVPVRRPARAAPPTLVCGPPGTGRTTRARELAVLPVKFLRPASALLEGEVAWAQDFEAAMRRTEGSVCIDGIELLSDKLLDLVIQYVDARRRPQLIFVSGPVSGLTGRAAALAGTASTREELLSLSARRTEIPELASSMLQSAAAGDSVHLTPGVVQALTAHEWPGNLRELKAVIVHAASRRTCGGIALPDLPQQYRCTTPATPMAALDRAERDVIVIALRNAGGNKVLAARELGVSRTTLYARIRQLRITAW